MRLQFCRIAYRLVLVICDDIRDRSGRMSCSSTRVLGAHLLGDRSAAPAEQRSKRCGHRCPVGLGEKGFNVESDEKF